VHLPSLDRYPDAAAGFPSLFHHAGQVRLERLLAAHFEDFEFYSGSFRQWLYCSLAHTFLMFSFLVDGSVKFALGLGALNLLEMV
jgi:hypothetical protein